MLKIDRIITVLCIIIVMLVVRILGAETLILGPDYTYDWTNYNAPRTVITEDEIYRTLPYNTTQRDWTEPSIRIEREDTEDDWLTDYDWDIDTGGTLDDMGINGR